jgi:hypothetical protein
MTEMTGRELCVGSADFSTERRRKKTALDLNDLISEVLRLLREETVRRGVVVKPISTACKNISMA